jgi:hypothetical protein
MRRKLFLLLALVFAGCHAGARVGPVHAGGGVSSH